MSLTLTVIRDLIPLARAELTKAAFKANPTELSLYSSRGSSCSQHRLPPRAAHVTVPATHNHGAFSHPSFLHQRGPQKSTLSRKPSQTAAGSSPKSSHSSTPHTPRPINHSSLKSHSHTMIWAVLGLTDDTAGIKQKVSFRKFYINRSFNKECMYRECPVMSMGIRPSPQEAGPSLFAQHAYAVSFSSRVSTPLLVLLFFSNVGIRLLSPALTLFTTSWSQL